MFPFVFKNMKLKVSNASINREYFTKSMQWRININIRVYRRKYQTNKTDNPIVLYSSYALSLMRWVQEL